MFAIEQVLPVPEPFFARRVLPLSQTFQRQERSENWDRIEGNWKEFKGKVQQKWASSRRRSRRDRGQTKRAHRLAPAALRRGEGRGRVRDRYVAQERPLEPRVVIGH